jgi:hypothetical protein
MTEDIEQVKQYVERTSRLRRRGVLIFLIAVLIAAAVVLPPLINISRYQREITALMTRSLGRPVRLSSVKLRLLPRPGFVLTNLSVGEAGEFGVEPILSAQTVVASIRLSALLTGKVEVDRINLDEASLNLVQSAGGRWNLESIMTGGLAQGLSQTAPTSTKPVFVHKVAAFPYLEATNSRVNLKRGFEKYPYSLVGTQLSFWQESPGVWRLRLRGQPARTDMEISAADTGDLRLEATLQMLAGHGLYDMPLKVQAEWREAQLGQLSRLLLGSDQGWRGDLTADLTMQGTADEAQTRGRLRATGVRRAEFVPATPLDFDVNCGLLYEHTKRAVRNLDCNTEIGDGKLHLKADLPGESGKPEAALAVDQMPLQAGLDMLRTLRSGFAPGVEADGKVSGSLQLSAMEAVPGRAGKGHSIAGQRTATQVDAKPGLGRDATAQAAQTALQGSMTVADGVLRGGALSRPLTLPKIVLSAGGLPGEIPSSVSNAMLSTRFGLPLGAPAPKATSATPVRGQEIALHLQLTAAGYQVGVSGSAAPDRLRELAYALGAEHSKELDGLAEGQADLQIMAAGPWVASTDLPVIQMEKPAQTSLSAQPGHSWQQSKSGQTMHVANGKTTLPLISPGNTDALAGTVELHRVTWSAPYFAHSVLFPEAVVSLKGKSASASGSFTYGALEGTASVTGAEAGCAGDACLPQVQIHLAATDAATIEGALLGAPEKKSLLSPLIDRMRSSQHASWPSVRVNVQADSLVLGPVTLHNPVFAMKLASKEMMLESWQANLLGGMAKGDGSAAWNGNQLTYKLTGDFSGLSGAQLGALLGHSPKAAKPESGETDDTDEKPAAAVNAGVWAGGPVDGSGKIELSGLTEKELAASAAGTLHFHWVKGSLPVSAASAAAGSDTAQTPTAASKGVQAVHFDAWTGDATIGGGKIVLGSNTLNQSKHASAVVGDIPFGGPARLMITQGKAQAQAEAGAAASKKREPKE